MPKSATRWFAKKTLRAGELSKALRTLHKEFDFRADEHWCSLERTLSDGLVTEKRVSDYAELEDVCDLAEDGFAIETSTKDANGHRVGMNIRGIGSSMMLSLEAESAERINEISDFLKDRLGLEEEEHDTDFGTVLKNKFNGIEQRITSLERAIAALKPPRSCFLSYRFNTPADSLAQELMRFLSLLDIQVQTGRSYEPRPISEKVMTRLDQDHDFVVLIVTGDGESLWTRDEIATAKAKGFPVIPLVEEGAQFVGGLFGDLEYVPFREGHIADTFIPLLEGIKYITPRAEERA